jgi:beta-glucosidase
MSKTPESVPQRPRFFGFVRRVLAHPEGVLLNTRHAATHNRLVASPNPAGPTYKTAYLLNRVCSLFYYWQGLTLALVDIQPTENGESRAAEYQMEMNDWYLEQLRGDDFVGVQTYSRMMVGPDGVIPPGADVEKNQGGEEFYPEALGGTIRHAAQVTGIPVIVTENGLSSTDDTRCLEYFQRALASVANCLESGIDVQGYFCWSALDNFEWVSGYRPKFGIISVDRETQQRTVKPSGHWLGAVARANYLQL